MDNNFRNLTTDLNCVITKEHLIPLSIFTINVILSIISFQINTTLPSSQI